MFSWKGSAALLLLTVVLVPVVLWTVPTCPKAKVNSGPQKMTEVRDIAKKLGWHWCSDDEDGSLAGQRVFLSEEPLDRERACSLALWRRLDADWIGIVAVYHRLRNDMEMHVLEGMVVWGDFILYGDPKLIQRLIAYTDSKSE